MAPRKTTTPPASPGSTEGSPMPTPAPAAPAAVAPTTPPAAPPADDTGARYLVRVVKPLGVNKHSALPELDAAQVGDVMSVDASPARGERYSAADKLIQAGALERLSCFEAAAQGLGQAALQRHGYAHAEIVSALAIVRSPEHQAARAAKEKALEGKTMTVVWAVDAPEFGNVTGDRATIPLANAQIALSRGWARRLTPAEQTALDAEAAKVRAAKEATKPNAPKTAAAYRLIGAARLGAYLNASNALTRESADAIFGISK